MKAFYLIPTLVLFLSASLLSNAETLTAEYQSQSPCKNHNRSYDEEEEWNTTFFISYDNGILKFSGVNVWANCVAALETNATLTENREIHFDVKEIVGDIAASCICNYDIEATYGDIREGNYDIYINNIPYGTVKISEGCSFNLTELSGIKDISSNYSYHLSIIGDDVLKVTAYGRTEVTAYDKEGRLRMKLSVEGDSEISLASLPDGMYLIMAKGNDSLHTVKYLKK